MFGIMTILWCRSWHFIKAGISPRQLKRSFMIIGLLCLCYGIGMEFVQKYFIPNRSFDVTDMMADGIGCVIGIVLSARWYIKK